MHQSLEAASAASVSAGPLSLFSTMLGYILSPPRPSERGMVTVEFIFGTLVVIAIVTVVATMLHDEKMATFLAGVFKDLVSKIFD
ncbi:hypothetical protein [Microlunatus soli]|uniref:Uncharacterized protein n=1 Tax=Microlunatus soli TaxID=630515 RepID=A0A1H1SZG8_9ACTN|nr:hypothetical protein [Microlunatus soli]SDS52789.1 hypothetical protein SAMN04489812_2179 [Microlunatus soli]